MQLKFGKVKLARVFKPQAEDATGGGGETHRTYRLRDGAAAGQVKTPHSCKRLPISGNLQDPFEALPEAGHQRERAGGKRLWVGHRDHRFFARWIHRQP